MDVMNVASRSESAEGHSRRFSLTVEHGLLWFRAIQGHSIPQMRAEDQLEKITPESIIFPSELAHRTWRCHTRDIIANGIIPGGRSRGQQRLLTYMVQADTFHVSDHLRPGATLASL